MNNATTQTVTTTTPEVEANAPSEKFLEYLIREFSSATASPEENLKAIAKAAWKHAHEDNRKRIPLSELVANTAKQQQLIETRVLETKNVMSNTLRKMTHGFPPHLAWATQGLITPKFVGVERSTSGLNSSAKNISYAISLGAETLRDSDTLVFSYTTFSYGTQTRTEHTLKLPAFLLKGDPIAIAQYVRRSCRQFVAKEERAAKQAIFDQHEALKQEQEIIEKKKEQLTKTLNSSFGTLKPASKDKPKRPAKPVGVSTK